MTLPPPFLFDLDGTLADTLPDIAASANHVRAVHGLLPAPVDVARSWLGDGARTLLSRALAEVLPAAGPPREAALDAAFVSYVDHHRGQCTVHARLFPGVLDHLTTLHERGHALAIVTNKPERFARPVVSHLGLDRLCAVIVGGDTLPVRKPDPAPLQHALQRLGRGSIGATMVGDGLQDLRPAKLLGLHTIACLFGYGDPVRLRAEGADAYWRAFGVPA